MHQILTMNAKNIHNIPNFLTLDMEVMSQEINKSRRGSSTWWYRRVHRVGRSTTRRQEKRRPTVEPRAAREEAVVVPASPCHHTPGEGRETEKEGR